MRIGLLTGEFPPMEGGVGAYTRELAKVLAALGHEVHILTSRRARPEDASRRLRDLNEPIDLGFAQLYPFIRQWRWPFLAQAADWAVRYELDLINIQYQAAAYHMRSPAVNFAPWRLNGVVKTAVTFHDLRVPYLFPKAGRLRETAVRFLARRAHGVIVTNQADYDTLCPILHNPLTLIPIGSNIPTYTPMAAEKTAVRQQLGLNDGDCLLGYFGFLNESKGADTLLAALAQLDNHTHLLFIGGQTGASDSTNQAFLAELREQVAVLGLADRVHWTGFVADAQVSTWLHAADMMVMPYRDGVSLRRGTLMAVLAHERPLITTFPQTPTPELVHQTHAWFVPSNDPPTLAAAIRTLQADPALRQRLGSGAGQAARLFGWEGIGEKTAVFFDRLLIDHSPNSR